MRTSNAIQQSCRYSYQCYTDMNITQCLKLNPWLFNHSYSIMAFYDTNTSIPKNVFKAEQNWITENFVLFSGSNDDFKNYDKRMDWDLFGTWYIYLFPAEIKNEKPLMIGRDMLLERAKEDDMAGYFNLSEAWQFIHHMQPDMFISRQKKGIMIGALSEINLMCIETTK